MTVATTSVLSGTGLHGAREPVNHFELGIELENRLFTIGNDQYACLSFPSTVHVTVDSFIPVNLLENTLVIVPSHSDRNKLLPLFRRLFPGNDVSSRRLPRNVSRVDGGPRYCTYQEFLNLLSGRKRKIAATFFIYLPDDLDRHQFFGVLPCIIERLTRFTRHARIHFLVSRNMKDEFEQFSGILDDCWKGNPTEKDVELPFTGTHGMDSRWLEEVMKDLLVLVLNLARHGFSRSGLLSFKQFTAVKLLLVRYLQLPVAAVSWGLQRALYLLQDYKLVKVNRGYVSLTRAGKVFAHYWLPLEKLSGYRSFCRHLDQDDPLSSMAVAITEFERFYTLPGDEPVRFSRDCLDLLAGSTGKIVAELVVTGCTGWNEQARDLVREHYLAGPRGKRDQAIVFPWENLPHVPRARKVDKLPQEELLSRLVSGINSELAATRKGDYRYPVLFQPLLKRLGLHPGRSRAALREFYRLPVESLDDRFKPDRLVQTAARELRLTTRLGKWASGPGRAKLAVMPVKGYFTAADAGTATALNAGPEKRRCRDCLFFDRELHLCKCVKVLLDFSPGHGSCPAALAPRGYHVPPSALACPAFYWHRHDHFFEDLPARHDAFLGTERVSCYFCGGKLAGKGRKGSLECRGCGTVFRKTAKGYSASPSLKTVLQKALLDVFNIQVNLEPHLKEAGPVVIRPGDRFTVRSHGEDKVLRVTTPGGKITRRSVSELLDRREMVVLVNRPRDTRKLTRHGLPVKNSRPRRKTLPRTSYREAIEEPDVSRLLVTKNVTDLLLSVAALPYWAGYFLASTDSPVNGMTAGKIDEQLELLVARSLVSAAKARSRASDPLDHYRQVEAQLFKSLNAWLKAYTFRQSRSREIVDPFLGLRRDRVIDDPGFWVYARARTGRTAVMNGVNRYASTVLRKIAATEGMGFNTVPKGLHVTRDDPGKAGHLDELENLRLFTRVKVTEWFQQGKFARNRHYHGVYSAELLKHYYLASSGLKKMQYLAEKEILNSDFWHFTCRATFERHSLKEVHRQHAGHLTGSAVELYQLKKEQPNWQPDWYYLLFKQKVEVLPYICLPAFPEGSRLPGPREMVFKALELVERFYTSPLRAASPSPRRHGELYYLAWIRRELVKGSWRVTSDSKNEVNGNG